MNYKKSISQHLAHGNESFNICRIIIRNQSKLPKGTFPVLIFLADKLPNIFPTIKTIAEGTGKHIRSVKRDLITLEKAGLLSITHRHGHSSSYKIIIRSLLGSDTHVTPPAQVVTPMSPGGCHPCHPSSDTGVTHKIQLKIQDKIADDLLVDERNPFGRLTPEEQAMDGLEWVEYCRRQINDKKNSSSV